ncbi:MAG TPA: hypothetical protein VL985_04680, partial [Stellaceae bacterium]|nr:hypothetical protein [Stellaceae bacterium]
MTANRPTSAILLARMNSCDLQCRVEDLQPVAEILLVGRIIEHPQHAGGVIPDGDDKPGDVVAI